MHISIESGHYKFIEFLKYTDASRTDEDEYLTYMRNTPRDVIFNEFLLHVHKMIILNMFSQ